MFLSSYFLFFRRLISEVSGPIVTKLCHMFGGDCNFSMWVKNLGVPTPQKFGAQKHQNFWFRPLIANVSRKEQDIVDLKTALKTAITLLRAYEIWWTLVHKQRKKHFHFDPLNRLSDAHISAHISGAKGHCPLKISNLVEADQRLLMHTSLGMGLPSTIF